MNTRTRTRLALRFVVALVIVALAYTAFIVVPELLFRAGWVAVVLASVVLFAIAFRPQRHSAHRA